MRQTLPARERGFSVVESTIASLVVIVITGAAASLLISAKRASEIGQPMVERTWMRATTLAEMTSTIRDAAARSAYFDLRRTVATLTRRDEAAKPGAPTAIPHRFILTPVASYGTGIEIGTMERGISLVGPVAALPDSTGLGGTQVGQALLTLRTERAPGTLRLAAPLVTSGPVIRLVARDDRDVATTRALGTGDVLVVTGRDTAGAVRTALVGLRTGPRAVSVPSPGRSDGGAIFQVFEAEIEAPDSLLLGYLRNSNATISGAEFLEDAAVVALARDGAIVTYYTAKDETGQLHLYRTAGNPFEPRTVELLLANVAAGLAVETDPVADAAKSAGADTEALTLVRIAVPLTADEHGERNEPLEAEVALLNAATGRKPVAVTWDAILGASEPTAGGGSK